MVGYVVGLWWAGWGRSGGRGRGLGRGKGLWQLYSSKTKPNLSQLSITTAPILNPCSFTPCLPISPWSLPLIPLGNHNRIHTPTPHLHTPLPITHLTETLPIPPLPLPPTPLSPHTVPHIQSTPQSTLHLCTPYQHILTPYFTSYSSHPQPYPT